MARSSSPNAPQRQAVGRWLTKAPSPATLGLFPLGRLKLAASGLCHTDWETMHGYQPVNLPAVIGHEGAGAVEAVGPGVTQVAEGDHVACSWSPNCGHCFY